MLAMQRAVAGLKVTPRAGHSSTATAAPDCRWRPAPWSDGDSLVAAISAASILAKVTRDADDRAGPAAIPSTASPATKGYPTAEHLAILAERGPLPEYR